MFSINKRRCKRICYEKERLLFLKKENANLLPNLIVLDDDPGGLKVMIHPGWRESARNKENKVVLLFSAFGHLVSSSLERKEE